MFLQSILSAIQNQEDPPGRFLKKDTNTTGMWLGIGMHRNLEKALREKTSVTYSDH
jgi:hypothetical protein